MPIKLTNTEIQAIQERYSYLVNYESDDPNCPIEPMSYIDSNGDGLLHIATSAGDQKTVELLLRAGADVNQTGDMRFTALHYARAKHFDVIADMLVAHGALTDIENDFGQIPGASLS